jgi:copper transport protein
MEPSGTRSRLGHSVVLASLLLGLIAVPLSVGLQGLDALGAPLAQLAQGIMWTTGFGTSWGTTALIGVTSLLTALCAMTIERKALARALALIGLAGVGLALAASGHASAASPQAVTRPAVFIHATGIALWAGALTPLAAALAGRGEHGVIALRRFSQAIPVILAGLILSGLALAVVQLERVGALWSTAYGNVLLGKLAAVALLLGIAGWNRFVLTRRVKRDDVAARRQLVRTIAVELVLVAVIFALASTWRFTPPPRALDEADAEPASIYVHTAPAVANVTFAPGRAGRVQVSIIVMTGNLGPLDAQGVSLTIANPAAGVDPITRPAAKSPDGTWLIDVLTIPLPGLWSARIDIRLADGTTETLEDTVEIRP